VSGDASSRGATAAGSPRLLLEDHLRITLSFRELVQGATEDDLRAGALIGAAVADEQAGVPGAVDSLMEWLADAARFPPRWLAAVEQTLQRARRPN
jgi:hypothetical protein